MRKLKVHGFNLSYNSKRRRQNFAQKSSLLLWKKNPIKTWKIPVIKCSKMKLKAYRAISYLSNNSGHNFVIRANGSGNPKPSGFFDRNSILKVSILYLYESRKRSLQAQKHIQDTLSNFYFVTTAPLWFHSILQALAFPF